MESEKTTEMWCVVSPSMMYESEIVLHSGQIKIQAVRAAADHRNLAETGSGFTLFPNISSGIR